MLTVDGFTERSFSRRRAWTLACSDAAENKHWVSPMCIWYVGVLVVMLKLNCWWTRNWLRVKHTRLLLCCLTWTIVANSYTPATKTCKLKPHTHQLLKRFVLSNTNKCCELINTMWANQILQHVCLGSSMGIIYCTALLTKHVQHMLWVHISPNSLQL